MSRLSAGIVIVLCVANEYRYLLLRAYRNWDFPKGLVEPGEAPFAAACREAQEETGLCEFEFRWGEVYLETAPYAGGKTARYYLARSASIDVVLGVNPQLGRPEHHEYRWLTYEAARPLLVARVAAVLDWARGVVGTAC